MQPRSKWDDLDFDLLSALDRLERDTNERTGLPWWQTRTGHPEVGIVIETTDDAAEAELDRYDEKQAGKKKRPGEQRFAAVTALGDWPIDGGLARERLLAYAAAQAEGQAEDDDAAALGVETRARGGEYDAALYG